MRRNPHTSAPGEARLSAPVRSRRAGRPYALWDRCRGRARALVVGRAGHAVKIDGGFDVSCQHLVGRRDSDLRLAIQTATALSSVVDVVDRLRQLCRELRHKIEIEIVDGLSIRMSNLRQARGIVIPEFVEGTDSIERSGVLGGQIDWAVALGEMTAKPSEVMFVREAARLM